MKRHYGCNWHDITLLNLVHDAAAVAVIVICKGVINSEEIIQSQIQSHMVDC